MLGWGIQKSVLAMHVIKRRSQWPLLNDVSSIAKEVCLLGQISGLEYQEYWVLSALLLSSQWCFHFSDLRF